MAYASRPLQPARLGQTAQSRSSTATAPSVAAVVVSDRCIGTTLTPIGATVRESRLNRAEHFTGSAGASACIIAPSKSRAAFADGKVCIETPQMSLIRHWMARAPSESTAKLHRKVNIANYRMNWFNVAKLFMLVGLAIAAWALAILLISGVVYALTALPVGP